jgi:hypothetical protein
VKSHAVNLRSSSSPRTHASSAASLIAHSFRKSTAQRPPPLLPKNCPIVLFSPTPDSTPERTPESTPSIPRVPREYPRGPRATRRVRAVRVPPSAYRCRRRASGGPAALQRRIPLSCDQRTRALADADAHWPHRTRPVSLGTKRTAEKATSTAAVRCPRRLHPIHRSLEFWHYSRASCSWPGWTRTRRSLHSERTVPSRGDPRRRLVQAL